MPRLIHGEKIAAYAGDITYGTNNEFGFDYLRDNMRYDPQEKAQRGLNYAIVDEVDSILIDEARTPLIISGEADDNIDNYRLAAKIAEKFVRCETSTRPVILRWTKKRRKFTSLKKDFNAPKILLATPRRWRRFFV